MMQRKCTATWQRKIWKPLCSLVNVLIQNYAKIRVTTLQTTWNSTTIPWWFAALLRGTRHVKCYSYHARTNVTVSGGGRNATVHDLKPYISYLTHSRLLLNACMDANMQLTINRFRQIFHDKIFSLTFPWFLAKSLTFPWQLSNSPTFPSFPDKCSPCKISNSTLHYNFQILAIVHKL